MRYESLDRPMHFNESFGEAVKSFKSYTLTEWLFVVIVCLVWVPMVIILISLFNGPPWLGTGLVYAGSLIVVIAAILIKEMRKANVAIKIRNFARDNELTDLLDAENPKNVGIIFRETFAEDQRYTHGVKDKDNTWTLANYEYVTGSGKSRKVHRYGVMIFKLPRFLPNVLFDNKKNNFFTTNLPDGINSGQKLTLEGDFNQHFDVYVPRGYERDLLYFMTPELMHHMIDEKAHYDFEIINDELYMYSRAINFNSNDTSKDIEHRLKAGFFFQKEFSQNVKRYADERIGDFAVNAVSKNGQLLKKGLSLRTKITIFILFIYIAHYVLAPFLYK